MDGCGMVLFVLHVKEKDDVSLNLIKKLVLILNKVSLSVQLVFFQKKIKDCEFDHPDVF